MLFGSVTKLDTNKRKNVLSLTRQWPVCHHILQKLNEKGMDTFIQPFRGEVTS